MDVWTFAIQLPIMGFMRKRPDVAERNYKHGFTSETLHHLWCQMRNRCSNPNATAYHRYGGRGIKVCPEWNDYRAFREWSLANGYEPGLQLDRRDNDKHYGPDNCRWVTPFENAQNRSRRILVRAFGEEKTIGQWVKDARCSVSYSVLRSRLKLGWDTEAAITTKKDAIHNYNNTTASIRLRAFGEEKTLLQWTSDPRCLVGYATLYYRHRKGWDLERAITTRSRQHGQ